MTTIEPHELTAQTNELPEGTTLDGKGKAIRLDDPTSAFIELADDCVVKNLTLIGHRADYIEQYGQWDYPSDQSAWREDSVAISVQGNNCTIENVTCRGWTHAGVQVGKMHGEHYDDITIRDCDLVDNNAMALGYGVVVLSGHPIIEECYLNNNRHDVAADGGDCGYEARYNTFGPNGRLYGCEMHEPGGNSVYIHHNTFADKRSQSGRRRSLIVNRGTPKEVCYVTHNWFQGEMTTSLLADAPSMYRFENNHEGPTPPPEGVGRPDERIDADDNDAITLLRLSERLDDTMALLTDLRHLL